MKEKVYRFIKQFIMENNYAPTMREIAEGIGCVPSTVHCHLQTLRLMGVVDYKDLMPRTIRILKELEG